MHSRRLALTGLSCILVISPSVSKRKERRTTSCDNFLLSLPFIFLFFSPPSSLSTFIDLVTFWTSLISLLVTFCFCGVHILSSNLLLSLPLQCAIPRSFRLLLPPLPASQHHRSFASVLLSPPTIHPLCSSLYSSSMWNSTSTSWSICTTFGYYHH